MFTCRALIEACLLVEEGVCSVRDIDVGMMAGAGLDPRKGLFPPFWKADVEGLDKVLERIEQLEEKHGERFAPPVTLRRLVAQGRLGLAIRPGLLPLPAARRGRAGRDGEAGDARRRRDRLARQRADERDLARRDPRPRRRSGRGSRPPTEIGAMVIASSIPVVFSAGADIKAFTQMDEGGGRGADPHRPRAAARVRPGAGGDDRRRQLARLRRRLRAGDGLRRADRRRGGGLRPARDQARDHPRLRRHPAAAAPGRPQQGAGDEPGRRRDPRRRGARVRPRQPRRPRPRAVRDGADVGPQAGRPGAGRASSRSSSSPTRATSTRASRPRSRASPPPSAARTPRRASAPSSASARRSGAASRATSRQAQRPSRSELAELIGESRCTVALTGAGVSVPSGIPDFRTPETGLWANVDPMEVAHIDVFERDPARFWSYYRPRFHSLGDKRPNAAHEALAELERRGLLEGVITQNIDRLHRAAGSRERGRGARLDRDLDLQELRGLLRDRGGRRALRRRRRRRLLGLRRAGQTRRRPVRRAAARERDANGPRSWPQRAELMLCVGTSLVVHPVAGPAAADARARRPAGDRHQGADALRRRRRAEAGGRGRRGARRRAGGARLDGRLSAGRRRLPRAPSSSTTTACCSTPSRSGRGPSRTSSSAAGSSSRRPTSASWSAPRPRSPAGSWSGACGEPGRAAELIEELNELVVAELEHGVEAMVGARELLHALQASAARRSAWSPTRRSSSSAARWRSSASRTASTSSSAPTKWRRRSRRPTPTWRPAAASGSSPGPTWSPWRTRRPGSPRPAPPA